MFGFYVFLGTYNKLGGFNMTLKLLAELVQKHDNYLVVESVLELPKEVVDSLNKILKEDGTILLTWRSPENTSIKFFVHSGFRAEYLTWTYCNPSHYPNKISNTEFLKYFKDLLSPPKCLRRL